MAKNFCLRNKFVTPCFDRLKFEMFIPKWIQVISSFIFVWLILIDFLIFYIVCTSFLLSFPSKKPPSVTASSSDKATHRQTMQQNTSVTSKSNTGVNEGMNLLSFSSWNLYIYCQLVSDLDEMCFSCASRSKTQSTIIFSADGIVKHILNHYVLY